MRAVLPAAHKLWLLGQAQRPYRHHSVPGEQGGKDPGLTELVAQIVQLVLLASAC